MASTNTATISVLSYNINLLPFGKQHVPSHANKDERMSHFISLVCGGNNSSSNNNNSNTIGSGGSSSAPSSPFDVIALQEVYSSPFLPSFAVPALCRQTRLIERFRERGFAHHAACEQPSLFAMARRRAFTDSGLVIVSKHPIEHASSIMLSSLVPPPPTAAAAASSSSPSSSSSSTRQPGCLFAAIRVPATAISATATGASSSVLVLVFNVHLSLGESTNGNNSGNSSSNSGRNDNNVDDNSSTTHINRQQQVHEDGSSSGNRAPLLPHNNSSFRGLDPDSVLASTVVVAAAAGGSNNSNMSSAAIAAAAAAATVSPVASPDTLLPAPDEAGLTSHQRQQVTELRHFIEATLQNYPRNTPFFIVGDFNINALTQVDSVGTTRASRAYLEMKAMLTPLVVSSEVPVREALLEALGHHPPTRPVSAAAHHVYEPNNSNSSSRDKSSSNNALSTPLQQLLQQASRFSKQNSNNNKKLASSAASSFRVQEMRHDYAFIGGSVTLVPKYTRVERFAVPEGFPFRFLSDHFALVIRATVTSASSSSSPTSSPSSSTGGGGARFSSSGGLSNPRSQQQQQPASPPPPAHRRLAAFLGSLASVASFLVPREMRNKRFYIPSPIGAMEVIVVALALYWLPWTLIFAVAVFLAAVFAVAYCTTEVSAEAAAGDGELAAGDDVVAGSTPMPAATQSHDSSGAFTVVASQWQLAVARSSFLPALGPSLFLDRCYARGWRDQLLSHDDISPRDFSTGFHQAFLTFSEVDRLALSLANGLANLCAAMPDPASTAAVSAAAAVSSSSTGQLQQQHAPPPTSTRIGVLLHSCPTSLLIDVALLVYGRQQHLYSQYSYSSSNNSSSHHGTDDDQSLAPPIVAVPLIGEAAALRAELDDSDCCVAITSVSQAKLLLTCHSRSLHTVIVVPDEPFYIQAEDVTFANGADPTATCLLERSAALSARDAFTAVPHSLELLATESSIQIVSMGELLQSGCEFTRSVQQQEQQNQQNRQGTADNNSNRDSNSKVNPDDLAMIMIDCRSTENSLVAASSPFHTKQQNTTTDSSSAAAAAPIYGRLLRLTHKNVARFVAQMSETGLVPPPSWIARGDDDSHGEQDEQEDKGRHQQSSKRTKQQQQHQHQKAASSPTNPAAQRRILFQDIHHSYMERWAALATLLSGHTAAVTRTVAPAPSVNPFLCASIAARILLGSCAFLRPNIVFSSLLPMTAARLMFERLVSTGYSKHGVVQQCYSYLFKNLTRFRDQLLERGLDSTVARWLFFKSVQRLLFGGSSIQRVVVASDEAVPYRVRHFLQLVVGRVAVVSFAPNVGLIAVNGVPPPRTLLRLLNPDQQQQQSNSPTNSSIVQGLGTVGNGEINIAGPAVLGCDKDSIGFASSGFVGAWHQQQQRPQQQQLQQQQNQRRWLLFIVCNGDSLLRPGTGRKTNVINSGNKNDAQRNLSSNTSLATSSVVCAASIERAYMYECASVIADIFIVCKDDMPLVAVVVPNKAVLRELLVQQREKSNSSNKNETTVETRSGKEQQESDDNAQQQQHQQQQQQEQHEETGNDDNQLDFSHDSALFRGDTAANIVRDICRHAFVTAGISHEIVAVHLHPHPFSEHRDFFRANGNRRRTRMTEYFVRDIERMYRQYYFFSVASDVDGATNSTSNNDDESSILDSLSPDEHDESAAATTARSAAMLQQQQQRECQQRQQHFPPIRPTAPFALDIGGTCAKFAFFIPQAMRDGLSRMLPSYCTIEKNDPATDAIGSFVAPDAVFQMMSQELIDKFSSNSNNTAQQQQQQQPMKFQLVCMKLPTSMISRFIQHMSSAPAAAVTQHRLSGVIVGSGSSISSSIPLASPLQSGILLRTPTAMGPPSSSFSRHGSASTPPAAAQPADSSSSTTVTPSDEVQQQSQQQSQQPQPAQSNVLAGTPASTSSSSKLSWMFKPDTLQRIPATGGGAFRFAGAARNQLGMGLVPVKEMESLVRGLCVLLERCPELAVFSYDTRTHTQARHKLTMMNNSSSQPQQHQQQTPPKLSGGSKPATQSSQSSSSSASNRGNDDNEDEKQQKAPHQQQPSPYPFLLVNVGSGVSIVKCSDSDGNFTRIGGSPVGGATFWGLARALTHIESWDELREITRVDGPGDHTKVDLLVGDIYGYNATALPAGLTVDTLASSFGKMASRSGAQSNANNNNLGQGDRGVGESAGAGGVGGGALVGDDSLLYDVTREVILMSPAASGLNQQQQEQQQYSQQQSPNHNAENESAATTTAAAVAVAASGELRSTNDDQRQQQQHQRQQSAASSNQIPPHTPVSTAGGADALAGAPQSPSRSQNQNQQQQQQRDAVTSNTAIAGAHARRSFADAAGPASDAAHLGSVDIIRSLLMLVSTNITQIAFLYARQEQVSNILFTGGFVRGNALVWNQMTRALQYWSSGRMTAHFLMNDGYIGVLGALLTAEKK